MSSSMMIKCAEFIFNTPNIIDVMNISNKSILCTSNKNTFHIDKVNFIKLIDNKYNTIVNTYTPNARYKYLKLLIAAFEMLEDNGEYIFIAPANMFKDVLCAPMLNVLMLNGCFTHVHRPYVVAIESNFDIIIVRYLKGDTYHLCMYNDLLLSVINNNGNISFVV